MEVRRKLPGRIRTRRVASTSAPNISTLSRTSRVIRLNARDTSANAEASTSSRGASGCARFDRWASLIKPRKRSGKPTIVILRSASAKPRSSRSKSQAPNVSIFSTPAMSRSTRLTDLPCATAPSTSSSRSPACCAVHEPTAARRRQSPWARLRSKGSPVKATLMEVLQGPRGPRARVAWAPLRTAIPYRHTDHKCRACRVFQMAPEL